MVRLDVTPPLEGCAPPTVEAPLAGCTFEVAGPSPMIRTLVKTVLLTTLGGPVGWLFPVAKMVRLADAITVM